MRSFTQLLVSAAVAAQCVVAAPTPDDGGPDVFAPILAERDGSSGANETAGTFSVQQIRNTNYEQPSGLEALLRAYNKYNATVPQSIKTAVKMNTQYQQKRALREKRATKKTMWGAAPAISPGNSDYAYMVPVKIGTPAQTIYLDLDTGSSDVWMMSSDTPASQIRGQKIFYPRRSSSIRRMAGYTWHIGYGDGSGAQGIVYQDRMAIGQAVVAKQAFGSAQAVSASFTADPNIPGLLGLGWSQGNTISPKKQPTFMDNLVPSLIQPVFTANLKHGTPGNYNFGYIAPFEYTGRVTYAGINPNSIYWQFAVTGYTIGARGKYNSYVFSAIADTGTSLLLLPDRIKNQYYAQVRGARFDSYWGAVVFPCSSVLPDFTFGVGSHRGFIPGKYMNYGQIDQTNCFGGIQSSGAFQFAIFGDVALKAQFVVFDYGSRRLGFANKKLT